MYQAMTVRTDRDTLSYLLFERCDSRPVARSLRQPELLRIGIDMMEINQPTVLKSADYTSRERLHLAYERLGLCSSGN
jgi:hypothetical protein